MAILPKFYLPMTLILADLLCKAANLPIFCAKCLHAVICRSFVLYSKKLLYTQWLRVLYSNFLHIAKEQVHSYLYYIMKNRYNIMCITCVYA